MKILIAGDYCDVCRVSDYIKKEDYSTLFGDIKPIIEKSDFGVVNFEFPIVVSKGEPIIKCGPNLKGQKKAIDAIKYAGFNVCTLANNHILDQGSKCCLETKRLLEDAAIKTVGAGKDIYEAADVLYLNKGGKVVAVINCCEHEFSIATDNSSGANPINPIKQYYKIQEARKKTDYVVVIVHGGDEFVQYPSPRMKELFHFYIDLGADAVINHHQHCYSGYETYKSKPIVYGLGNFLFDNNKDFETEWNYGYMVSIDFVENADPSIELYPYKQCGSQVGIKELVGKELEDFNKKIKSINYYINSDAELQKKWESELLVKSRQALDIFQPYNNRLFKSLYYKNILPSFINKKKIPAILNALNCESHLDKLRLSIEQLLKSE